MVSVNASATTPALEGGEDGAKVSPGQKVVAFQRAFWKFLRPHTIRGSILGATAVTARALLENQHLIDWGLMPRALLGVVALVCGNGFIVGINQVYDKDLDKVNKPFLPVASGELSTALAWALVLGMGAGGIAIVSSNFGKLITQLYCLGLVLGTIYSVPPFRLKRWAVPAFLIIATVRGFLLNFGVYYATRAAIGLPQFTWSPAIAFITVFVTIFATVIALTKDLADIEGDRQFKIDTFATRLGPERLAFAALALLLTNYIGAIVLALKMPQAFTYGGRLMIGAHAALGAAAVRYTLQARARGFDRAAIAAFYVGIWNLFYSEYFLLPFL